MNNTPRAPLKGGIKHAPPDGGIRHVPIEGGFPSSPAYSILILHGWGGSQEKWRPVVERLKRAGEDVHIFDLPGFGGTPLATPWNLDDYCQYVKTYIESHHLRDLILIGHSFGGRIAIKLVVQSGSLVRRLILIDAAGIKETGGYAQIRKALFLLLAKIGKRLISLVPSEQFHHVSKKILYRLAGVSDYQNANPVMKETMKHVLEEDLEPLLPQIQLPTKIIWGENDRMTPLKDGKCMHELIKASQFVVLKGVGHSPHLQAPEQLVLEILKFMKSE